MNGLSLTQPGSARAAAEAAERFHTCSVSGPACVDATKREQRRGRRKAAGHWRLRAGGYHLGSGGTRGTTRPLKIAPAETAAPAASAPLPRASPPPGARDPALAAGEGTGARVLPGPPPARTLSCTPAPPSQPPSPPPRQAAGIWGSRLPGSLNFTSRQRNGGKLVYNDEKPPPQRNWLRLLEKNKFLWMLGFVRRKKG